MIKRVIRVSLLVILFVSSTTAFALQVFDGDGDGVPDSQDQCPNEQGSPLNNGCPLPDQLPDADGDGTADFLDLCPTVYGSSENNGCPPGQAPENQPTPTTFNIPPLPNSDTCIAATGSTQNVNIRAEPNVGAPIVGVLTPFEVVNVIMRYRVIGGDNWILTDRGWIVEYVLRFGGDCSALAETVTNPSILSSVGSVISRIIPLQPIPENVRFDIVEVCGAGSGIFALNAIPTDPCNPAASTVEVVLGDSRRLFFVDLPPQDGANLPDPQTLETDLDRILIGLLGEQIDPDGILIGLLQPTDPMGILIGLLRDSAIDPQGILIGLLEENIDPTGILIGLLQGSVDATGILIGLLQQSIDPTGILIGLNVTPDAEQVILVNTRFGGRSALWGFRQPDGEDLSWGDLLFVMSYADDDTETRGRIVNLDDAASEAFDLFGGAPFIINSPAEISVCVDGGACTLIGLEGLNLAP